MPSASPELRARMQKRFGDPISDMGPMQFLESRGYALTRDWCWSKPGLVLAEVPEDELECIQFLADEWDFGGIAP